MAGTPRGNGPTSRKLLAALGGAQVLVYAAVLPLSFSFADGRTDRPILPVVGLFLAATLCYFGALTCVLRHRDDDRRSLVVVLLFAVLGRLVLLPSQPVLEVDFYRYLWDGRVTLRGFDPYRYSPAQVQYADDDEDAPAELLALQRLSRETGPVQTIFSRVHWPAVPTVYPPAAQAVFAAAAALTPAAAPVADHVLTLKALLLAFDLGTVGVLVALLRHLRLPAAWCLAYAWCPLVLKEVANSGHLDSIAAFFTTLALYLLVRRATLTGACAAAACLGLGVLAKSYPVILLPVVAAFLLARLRLRAAIPLAVCPLVVAAGYLPFLARPRGEVAHNPGSGLGTFLTEWETNDFLFMLAYANVKDPRPGGDEGPAVVPAAWRERLHRDYLDGAHDLGLPLKANAAFLLTQVGMGLVLLALCARWAWQVHAEPAPALVLAAAFRTLAWGWLLSSAQNPWYLLWCLPLMVFDGRRCWFLLPALVWLYYVRFWLTDAFPAGAGPVSEAGLAWLEFGPFFLALAAETLWGWGRPLRVPQERLEAVPV